MLLHFSGLTCIVRLLWAPANSAICILLSPPRFAAQEHLTFVLEVESWIKSVQPGDEKLPLSTTTTTTTTTTTYLSICLDTKGLTSPAAPKNPIINLIIFDYQFLQQHKYKHLSLENILADCQHGFRSQRSCENQLVQFFHDMVSNLDRALNRGHRQTDVIIMDFAKAFDKVLLTSGSLHGSLSAIKKCC